MGMISLRHLASPVAGEKFSILVPTWNNLPFLKLCIHSIRKNSAFAHQVIVHVNEGNDGTLEWVKESGLSFTYSEQNIGVCWAMNAMRSMVTTDYLVFMNDDMYVCPGWDTAIDEEIRSLGHPWFYLSSTLIQPRPFWCKSVIAPANYGEDVASFDEEALLQNFMNHPHGDWSGATWPPSVLHREMWDLAGGFSIEFSPGLYSDPDLSAKLYMAGVRHFKGIDRSRVYHFEARSTGRVRKNKGTRQFLVKWGITSSSFMKLILHRGEPFENQSINHSKLRKARIKSRLKRIWTAMGASGQVKFLWDHK
jgi:glycosyltransferase involved in cell wall biosynthesis